MHPTYTVGAPGLTQSIGGVGVASGGGMRYDAFPLMGQVPHHTVGAHASYVAQPATQYGTYHNTRSDGGLPLSRQTQEQNGRGGFGGGHRRRYPNQGGEQAMTYLQPHYGAGSQLHIPVGAGQAVAYGGQVHPQNRSRGPIVVVPSTRTASSYPDHPRYSGGFTFKLFNDDRTHFIHLPSQYVLVTEGSTRYLGSGKPEQMAPRFTLCRHILQDRVCPRGSLCNFIHGVVSSAEGDPAFRRIEVHKNDAMETGVAQYELLPVGANLVVAYPGEERTINIPSQNVYKTRGSELYLRMLPEGTPQKVPQRCTHYHFKKMCHRGAGCSFIHIAYDTGMLPSISNCAGSEETSALPNNNEMLQN